VVILKSPSPPLEKGELIQKTPLLVEEGWPIGRGGYYKIPLTPFERGN